MDVQCNKYLITVKPLNNGIMFVLANLSLLRKFLLWEMMVRAMKNRASKIINITTQDRIYSNILSKLYFTNTYANII